MSLLWALASINKPHGIVLESLEGAVYGSKQCLDKVEKPAHYFTNPVLAAVSLRNFPASMLSCTVRSSTFAGSLTRLAVRSWLESMSMLASASWFTVVEASIRAVAVLMVRLAVVKSTWMAARDLLLLILMFAPPPR